MQDLNDIRLECIMTSPAVCVASGTSLQECARLLTVNLISCVIVEEAGRPVGILTERDLTRVFAEGASSQDPVGERLRGSLVCAAPDDTVHSAMKTMAERRLRHLPVARDGRIVGLITQTNLTAFSEAMLREYSRALEEQVAQQTAALREAGAFKDYILRMAAHDLNNPLTVILGCGEIILESLANESPDFQRVLAESVETMRKQAWAMGRLLSDILGFSRIQRGKLSLELGPAAINEVVAARLEAHETLARRKGISVRTDLKEGLPDITMDVERIGEAVDNLLSNAVKYSRQGGEVWIKTAASAEGGVLIEVKDTGAGIAQQDFPKLFREFSRLGNKPTGGEGSTGMGLAIVKKIVELHGGDVRVSSLPGRGSTFGFTLPRPTAAEAPGDEPRSPLRE